MRSADLSMTEKKYIEVQFDAVTQGYLREYCYDNNFDLSIKFDGSKQSPENFDFHTTLWYTTTEHNLSNRRMPVSVTATASHFSLFGPDNNILVIELNSPDIEDLRNFYGSMYGMKDMWPDFKPHISLCYNYKGDIPDIPLPDIDLVADVLEIKTQKK